MFLKIYFITHNYYVNLIIWLMFIYTFYFIQQLDGKKFPIGIVFDEETTELDSVYNFAKTDLSNYSMIEYGIESKLMTHNDSIPSSADSCKISQYVTTEILDRGILAIVCALSNTHQIYSFLLHTYRLQIPFIAPQIPISLVGDEVGLGVRLQPVGMQVALLDLISHYGYKKFIYLYNSYEGIHGLQAFHDRLNAGSDSISIAIAKKFNDTAQALEILENIESTYRWTFKMIVLDCEIPLAKRVLLAHVADRNLGRRTYHYLLSGFAFDEYWDPEDLIKISYLNITGFRIVNPDRPYVRKYLARLMDIENKTGNTFQPILTANGAFLYDSILVLHEGLSHLSINGSQTQTTNENFFNPTLSHSSSFNNESRKEISRALRKVKVEGLTGAIQFKKGKRINYALDVMEVSIHGNITKVGEWKDGYGFTDLEEDEKEEEIQRPYIVTSLLDEPFLMEQIVEEGRPIPQGNEKYIGFVKDLMDEIAKNLNISYTINITKDGKHGSKSSTIPGGWNGMVGELVRFEADLAVSSLTVNAEREMAIYLSKPFMFVGISIMLYKPDPDIVNDISADVFEFMRPLSKDTWICVGIAYIAVCLVLYSIARFNQKELDSIEKHGVIKLRTQFSVSNSLWFTFASLVSQGTSICPRSLACRLVGSVWWFFTLILIASYTANFAAFQTANKMVQPINSVSDLVSQEKVKYGTLAGGSTQEFFKKTGVLDYKKMNAFMTTTKGVHVKSYDEGIDRVRREKGKYAFLMESLKNEYINRRMPCNTMRVGGNLDMNGFAIGLSKETTLKVEDISRLILEFRGSGQMDLLQNKWWPQENECEGLDRKLPKEERGRLSMRKLAGVFYVLIAVIIVALVIAILEKWWKFRNPTKLDSTEIENLKPEKDGKFALLCAKTDCTIF